MSEKVNEARFTRIDAAEGAKEKMKAKYEALERLAVILKDENRDLKQLILDTGRARPCVPSSSSLQHEERLSLICAPIYNRYPFVSDDPLVQAERRPEMGVVRGRSKNDIQHLKRWFRTISAQIVDVQEQERKRVSRELHDGVCQSLVGLRMLLETILSESEKEQPTHDIILQALDIAHKTENDVRSIMVQLRPPNLREEGLKKAIEQAIAAFQLADSHVCFRCEITERHADVPGPLQLVIYRIIQEAVNNIHKHSAAASATISLHRDSYRLRLTIEDDGDGFDEQAVLNTNSSFKGMGLTSMQDRVLASCGMFTLDTEVGRGTRIVCEWDPNLHEQHTD